MMETAFSRALRALTAAVVLALAFASASWAEEKKVVFLQVNDVYKTLPVMPENLGGFARLKTLVDEEKKKNPGALFILSGDFLSPSIVSKMDKGSAMMEALNMVGLDIVSLGNHEFDAGLNELEKRIRESRKRDPQFTWLNSNLFRDGKLIEGTVESALREINGVKVGIFAIVSKKAMGVSPEVEVRDGAETSLEMTRKLKAAGADVVVAMTHQNLDEDEYLAGKVPGLSLILGGHDHINIKEMVSAVMIVKCGSNAKILCAVELAVDPSASKTTIRDIPVDAHFVENEEVKKKMEDSYRRAEESFMKGKNDSKSWKTVVGKTKVKLDGTDLVNRNEETNLGDFVTDAVRDVMKTQTVILNSGGFRLDRDLGPGDITYEDILELDYYGNKLVKMEVTGKALKQALEHGLSGAGSSEGKFPQISGMRVEWRAEGKKAVIESVTVGSQKLDEAKTYTLATGSFMAKGGDGYEMFKGGAVTEEKRGLRDIIISALDGVEISPKADGRISKK